MKIIRAICWCILMLLAYIFYLKVTDDTPEHVRIASKLMGRAIKDIQKEYGLSCYGSGGMMMDNIKKVDLYFTTIKPLPVDQARELMFEIVSIPLTLFNESEEVNPHLNQFPFDLSSIGVRLAYFSKVTGEELNNYVRYMFYQQFPLAKPCLPDFELQFYSTKQPYPTHL